MKLQRMIQKQRDSHHGLVSKTMLMPLENFLYFAACCCKSSNLKIALTDPFPSPVQLWRPQNRILFEVNTTRFRVGLFGHQGYNEPRRDARCRTHHCHKLTTCCLKTQRHNGTASYCNSHPGNAGNVRPEKANFVDSIPLHKLHRPSSSPLAI
jgi:hypothetical protein